MPEFQLPSGPPETLDLLELLDVTFDVDVAPSDVSQVKGFLNGRNDVHVTHRKRITIGSRSGELSSVIGVHDDPRDSKPNDVYLHGHVRVERRTKRSELEAPDAAWSAAVKLLCAQMGTRAAAVTMRLRIPLQGAITAVQLPIAVGRGEVTGFSEIRGVQLSQPDPEDPKKTLYSAILQRTEDRLNVDVLTTAAVMLDSATLEFAFGKAMSVARLAVPSIEVP
jgi:hypothetical protein